MNKFPVIYRALCCGKDMTFTYNGQLLFCDCWTDVEQKGVGVDIGDGYYIRVLGHGNVERVSEGPVLGTVGD